MRLLKRMDLLRGKDEGQSQPRLLTIALDRLLEASARFGGRQQGADEGDLFLAGQRLRVSSRTCIAHATEASTALIHQLGANDPTEMPLGWPARTPPGAMPLNLRP